MYKVAVILITIIISIYGLAIIQFEDCGFGFNNVVKITPGRYCPLSTLDALPITIMNLFNDNIISIVNWFIYLCVVTSLLIVYSLDDLICLINKIVRQINAQHSALYLWLRQFGSGFVSGSYL